MWCPQSWVCEYFYIPVNGQIQLWTPFSRPEGFRLRDLPLYLIHPCLCFDLQLSQVKRTPPPPPRSHPLVVVDFRFICAFLHAWWSVNSHLRQLRNFYQPSFPEFDVKYLLRNLIHSKIFNLTKYREVLVKYSPLITHAGRPKRIWHQSRERLTDSFFK